MPEPLDYDPNLPVARVAPPKPRWIGAFIAISVVASAFALLVCLLYRDQGLFDSERASIWLGLGGCAVCLLIGGINLVLRVRRCGMEKGTVLSVLGIISGIVLIIGTVISYYRIYGIR